MRTKRQQKRSGSSPNRNQIRRDHFDFNSHRPPTRGQNRAIKPALQAALEERGISFFNFLTDIERNTRIRKWREKRELRMARTASVRIRDVARKAARGLKVGQQISA